MKSVEMALLYEFAGLQLQISYTQWIAYGYNFPEGWIP